MATTELATMEVKDVAEFQIFSNQDIDLDGLFNDNLEDESFGPEELQRITVPSGGGTTFEIPTIDGVEEVKEIEAIILKSTPVRLFWKEDFGGGEGTPPDCRSDDLINGVGDPGGLCSQCPMNKFNDDGTGKACTEKRNIFILPANSLLPYNLTCPVKSIKNFKQYRVELTRRGLSLSAYTTLISLEKAKNNRGITYSQLVFRAGRPLTKEQAAIVRQYRDSFGEMITGGNGKAQAQTAGGPVV